MNLDIVRSQSSDLDKTTHGDICELWAEWLIRHRSMDAETALRSVHESEDLDIESMRQQLDMPGHELYTLRRRGIMAAAVRISCNDALGLGWMMSGRGHANPMYIENFGSQSRGDQEFREVVAEARDYLSQQMGRITHLRAYLDTGDKGPVATWMRRINPRAYEESNLVVVDQVVGGIPGEYRLHSVQFPEAGGATRRHSIVKLGQQAMKAIHRNMGAPQPVAA